MKIKYDLVGVDWDANLVSILSKAIDTTKSVEKKETYISAIETIAEAYMERYNARLIKTFDVEVTKKSVVTVEADNEKDALEKAVGVDSQNEVITTTLK